MFANNPRFTRYLARNGFFNSEPMVIVDVGARGGIESHWSNYGNGIRSIGFEPDLDECERLNNAIESKSNSKFYPVALYKDKGSYTFYHTTQMASSLYPGNTKLVNRFPDELNILKINKTSIINTTDFDFFAMEHNVLNVDFMKLDTEGSELDVLKGSIDQLRNTVLGLSCEVLFSPWRGENRTFTEIEQFLRPLGFRLYDFESISHFAKKSFPYINSALPKKMSGIAPYGQIIQGQAIFFRDPVAELEDKKLLQTDWDQVRIIKAASLFEVFGLPDCAIELLDTAFKRGLITNSEKVNLDKFRDLIASGFLGQNITYEHYVNNLENIKKRGYLTKLDRFKFYRRFSLLMRMWRQIKRMALSFVNRSGIKHY